MKAPNYRQRRSKYLGSIYKRWHLKKYTMDVIMRWKPGDQEGYVLADVIACHRPCKLNPYPYRITTNDFKLIKKFLEASNQEVPKEIKEGVSK